MWQLSKFPIYVKLICEFQYKATAKKARRRNTLANTHTNSQTKTRQAKQYKNFQRTTTNFATLERLYDHFTDLRATKSSNINFNAWMKQGKRKWAQQISVDYFNYTCKKDEIHIELSSHIDFHNLCQIQLKWDKIVVFVQKRKSYTFF